MSINDVFWLFLMFSALQPVLRQQMLNAARARKIARLESQRNSRVILLVHRQETMRLLGFPLVRYIDINDSEKVLRAIQMTDEDVPLDIVLHTPGGLVLADNVFLFGELVDKPTGARATAIAGMQAFHQILANSGRFRATVLPTGEGMAVGVRI